MQLGDIGQVAVNSLCSVQKIYSSIDEVDRSHDFVSLFRMMSGCCLALAMRAYCLLGKFKVAFTDFIFELLNCAGCLYAKSLQL
jgi:hypothetical protein